MPTRPQPLRIAIDTGGTFTDCVWTDPKTRRLQMLKVFSTPADPSQAIVEAAQKARAFEEQGDKEQAQTWRRIEAALMQMRGPHAS